MREIPDDLRRQAMLQSGAVSKAQCVAHGMKSGAPARMVKLRRWQRPHPGVYVIHTGSLDAHTRIWAALLAAGPGAAACYQTAIWLASPKGKLKDPLHIAVPVDRALRQTLAGVVIHRMDTSRAMSFLPPRMPLAVSLLGVVHREKEARDVIGLVCDVLATGKTDPPAVIRELKKRPRQRWRSLLMRMLDEVAAGAETPLEIADLRNDQRHGLPRSDRQVNRQVSGQVQRVDVVIKPPGVAEPVVKELDGRLGHVGAGTFRDMRRDNVTVLRGGLPLRFGWIDVVVEGCAAAAWQALLYQRLGWTGSPKLCGSGCTIAAALVRLDLEHPWEVAAPA